MTIKRLAALTSIFLIVVASAPPSQAQTEPEAVELQSYQARLFGLPEFECVSVKGVGVDIILPDGDKNRVRKGSKPVPTFTAANGAASSASTIPSANYPFRIHHIQLERRFTKDREFHAWVQKAKAGMAEPRDGVLMLQDSSGTTQVRFSFVKARPIRWKINIPPKDGPKRPVTETVTLCVQAMEMTY